MKVTKVFTHISETFVSAVYSNHFFYLFGLWKLGKDVGIHF